MSNTKIVIVDMVNGFVKEGALHDEHIMGIVDNIKSLIDHKRDADIIVLEDNHEDNCMEFNSFPVNCLNGTSESKTIDELQYVFGLDNFKACVHKNSTNGIFKLIDNKLIDEGEYVLVGCCTDICVMQLALALKTYGNEYNKDIKVKVIEDACDTYHASYHDRNEYEKASKLVMSVAGVEIAKLDDYLK